MKRFRLLLLFMAGFYQIKCEEENRNGEGDLLDTKSPSNDKSLSLTDKNKANICDLGLENPPNQLLQTPIFPTQICDTDGDRKKTSEPSGPGNDNTGIHEPSSLGQSSFSGNNEVNLMQFNSQEQSLADNRNTSSPNVNSVNHDQGIFDIRTNTEDSGPCFKKRTYGVKVSVLLPAQSNTSPLGSETNKVSPLPEIRMSYKSDKASCPCELQSNSLTSGTEKLSAAQDSKTLPCKLNPENVQPDKNYSYTDLLKELKPYSTTKNNDEYPTSPKRPSETAIPSTPNSKNSDSSPLSSSLSRAPVPPKRDSEKDKSSDSSDSKEDNYNHVKPKWLTPKVPMPPRKFNTMKPYTNEDTTPKPDLKPTPKPKDKTSENTIPKCGVKGKTIRYPSIKV